MIRKYKKFDDLGFVTLDGVFNKEDLEDVIHELDFGERRKYAIDVLQNILEIIKECEEVDNFSFSEDNEFKNEYSKVLHHITKVPTGWKDLEINIRYKIKD